MGMSYRLPGQAVAPATWDSRGRGAATSFVALGVVLALVVVVIVAAAIAVVLLAAGDHGFQSLAELLAVLFTARGERVLRPPRVGPTRPRTRPGFATRGEPLPPRPRRSSSRGGSGRSAR